MKKTDIIDVLQVVYDFKIFIHNNLFYNFTQENLDKFANYMDKKYSNDLKKYNIILKTLTLTNFSSVFCDDLVDYVNNGLINNNHLLDINNFINNYIDKNNNEYKDKYNIALYDFKLGYENHEIINVYDIYNFANYMQGFYPKIPYFDVANNLSLIANSKNQKINIDTYNYLFNHKVLNLDSIRSGHFMEIINFSRNKNCIYTKNKMYVKK